MKELALVPLDLDGKSIEEVISCAGDVATFAYTMLLTGALTISGPDASEISGFYEKIKGKNHFETLGVEKSAGTPEIKSAFRRLARAYHPDFFEKNPEKQAVATKIFGIVAKAYGALSNEKERRKYIECLEKGAVDDSTVIFDKIVMAEDAFKKGKASLRLGNFAGARENFERAVEFNPEDGEICAYLGWTVFNTGKTPQDSARARELISNAIKMNGKLSMGYYFLGSIHRVEGDEEKALMFYEKALHLDPKLVEAQREVRLINMRRRKKKGFLGKFFKT
jgi:curved DNA-binding protein CbpA